MKKNLTVLIIIVLMMSLVSCSQKSTTTTTEKIDIRIKGSDTCLPISQKLAENYIKENSGASISVTGGGTGVGLSALQAGTTEIAQASRKIKMSEKMELQNNGKEVTEVAFSYDALAVIVNPANKVSKLTREQLEDIFTGKITNWKEVGGEDMKIIVYSRETSSGTYEFFREEVLQKKNFVSSALMMPATGSIIQSIGQTKGAISYVGLAYLDGSVKALEVSYDQGETFISPSVKNAQNETYPITRPLFYYYLTQDEEKVASFIKFVLSPEGQAIVEKEGYVPVPTK